MMALFRYLLQRFMRNKRKAQEEHDIWKLYHLLYYHDQSGGCEVQVSRPPDFSYHEQYHNVHSMVTQQVCFPHTIFKLVFHAHKSTCYFPPIPAYMYTCVYVYTSMYHFITEEVCSK